jgi:alpha-L-fucosidase
MLNVSPMGDGSIPEIQQQTLHVIGDWLRDNGEAIYGSRPWRIMGEGPGVPLTCPPDWRGGSTDDQTNTIHGARPRVQITEANFRFTTANGRLYAFGYRYPTPTGTGTAAAATAAIRSLSSSQAKVERVTLLGPSAQPLNFSQSPDALNLALPPTPPIPNMPYTLRIEGTQGLGLS